MKYRTTVPVLWLALLLLMMPVFCAHLLPDWVLRVYASLWIGKAVSTEWVRRRAEERQAASASYARYNEVRAKLHFGGLIKRDVQ